MFLWCSFLAAETVLRLGIIQKANMMYLSREATNKDQSLKMKLLLLTDDKTALDTELIWKKSGFFGYQKGVFTINKLS